jgi:tetratricopeptide (TPR) repeat protein
MKGTRAWSVARSSRPPAALWVVVNALLLAFAVQGLHFDDTDTFYHLAGGRWMLEHGRVLDRETFSFTIAGQPWTDYSWGFQLMLAAAERAGGLRAVIGVRALLVLLTGNLLLFVIWRLSGRQRLPATALTLLGLALYLSRALNVRPHLVSHLLLIALIALLERFRTSPARVDPWIPALFLVWANLHGVEYPVGLAVVAAYAAAGLVEDASPRRWVLLAAMCFTALLLNPFGVRLLAMPAMVGDAEMMAVIDEMRPLSPASLLDLFPHADLTSQAWLNVALLAGLWFVPRWVVRRDVRSLALFALAFVLALRSLRFRPEAGILLACLLAAEGARLTGAAARHLRRACGVAVVLLVVASVATVFDHVRRGFFRTLDLQRYPEAACRLLAEQGLAGHALVDPSLAGYVTWCAPSVRILADMRSPDPFPAALEWMAAAAGQEVSLAEIDRRFGLDLVLVRQGSAAAERLLANPDAAYAPVSVDARFVLFARAALARERALVVRHPRGADSPAPPDELRAQSDRLLRTWSGNAFANETLARLDLEQGRPADAARRAAELGELYPRDATWPWIVGRARAAQNDLAGAEDALRRARRWSPESTRVAIDLARVQLARRRFAEGVEVMESDARRRSYRLSGEQFVLLGALREGAGRPEAAADAYTRALWVGGPGVDDAWIRSRLAVLPRGRALVPPGPAVGAGPP